MSGYVDVVVSCGSGSGSVFGLHSYPRVANVHELPPLSQQARFSTSNGD